MVILVFHFVTYEGAVDVTALADAAERRVYEAQAINFGQTPSQLLTRPHPRRAARPDLPRPLRYDTLDPVKVVARPPTVALGPLGSGDGGGGGAAAAAARSGRGSAIVFVAAVDAASTGGAAALLNAGTDLVVTVDCYGAVARHRLRRKATERDHTDDTRVRLAAPFAHDVEPGPALFALSADGRHLYSAGHWDRSFRVLSLDGGSSGGGDGGGPPTASTGSAGMGGSSAGGAGGSGGASGNGGGGGGGGTRTGQAVVAHDDMVSCVALTTDGRTLVTGSRDTTLLVWDVDPSSGVVRRPPVHTLHGHDSEVTVVLVSTEYDLIVSGARDGTCMVHTLRAGRYVRTLRLAPPPAHTPTPPPAAAVVAGSVTAAPAESAGGVPAGPTDVLPPENDSSAQAAALPDTDEGASTAPALVDVDNATDTASAANADPQDDDDAEAGNPDAPAGEEDEEEPGDDDAEDDDEGEDDDDGRGEGGSEGGASAARRRRVQRLRLRRRPRAFSDGEPEDDTRSDGASDEGSATTAATPLAPIGEDGATETEARAPAPAGPEGPTSSSSVATAALIETSPPSATAPSSVLATAPVPLLQRANACGDGVVVTALALSPEGHIYVATERRASPKVLTACTQARPPLTHTHTHVNMLTHPPTRTRTPTSTPTCTPTHTHMHTQPLR
jgi:hypothetical protein